MALFAVLDIWKFPKSWDPKSSKSWMTILVLKPMVTWGSPILKRFPGIVVCPDYGHCNDF